MDSVHRSKSKFFLRTLKIRSSVRDQEATVKLLASDFSAFARGKSTPLPSEARRNRPWPPSRRELKTMCLPPGDHAGSKSPEWSSVRGVALPVASSISQISLLGSASLEKS